MIMKKTKEQEKTKHFIKYESSSKLFQQIVSRETGQ